MTNIDLLKYDYDANKLRYDKLFSKTDYVDKNNNKISKEHIVLYNDMLWIIYFEDRELSCSTETVKDKKNRTIKITTTKNFAEYRLFPLGHNLDDTYDYYSGKYPNEISLSSSKRLTEDNALKSEIVGHFEYWDLIKRNKLLEYKVRGRINIDCAWCHSGINIPNQSQDFTKTYYSLNEIPKELLQALTGENIECPNCELHSIIKNEVNPEIVKAGTYRRKED